MPNWRDIISSVIFYAGLSALCALLVHYGSSYGWYKVDEQFREMEPKLGRGDYVWVSKRVRRPERFYYGDIVMYRRPLWKRTSYHYEYGRVVGKPGDVVKLEKYQLYRAERREGKLGPMERVTERYVEPHHRPDGFSAFVVPRNTLFVLFDDRSRREPLRNFLVPSRAIHGRVMQ